MATKKTTTIKNGKRVSDADLKREKAISKLVENAAKESLSKSKPPKHAPHIFHNSYFMGEDRLDDGPSKGWPTLSFVAGIEVVFGGIIYRGYLNSWTSGGPAVQVEALGDIPLANAVRSQIAEAFSRLFPSEAARARLAKMSAEAEAQGRRLTFSV